MSDNSIPLADGAASADGSDPGPAPVQFRLKTLLSLTAAVSVAFAAMGRLSVVWAVALAWFLLLVAGHVAANAMQTRAVDHATPRRRRDATTPRCERSRDANEAGSATIDMQQACAPTTRLGSQARLGTGLTLIVGLGAIVGCVLGTALIFVHTRGELGRSAFFLAAISSAGIGAFLSFLAGSCAKVTSKAFREATTTADPQR